MPREVTQKKRRSIYERDGWACRYCGWVPPATGVEGLTLDHVVPVARGGDNSRDNLVTCCFSCNQEKADRYLEVWRDGDAVVPPPPPDDTPAEIEARLEEIAAEDGDGWVAQWLAKQRRTDAGS